MRGFTQDGIANAVKLSKWKSNLLTIRSPQFYLRMPQEKSEQKSDFFLVKTCILYKKHYKSDNLLFHIFIQNANDKYQNDL